MKPRLIKPKSHKLPVGFSVSGVVGMAGGCSAVARELGVSPQAVSKWKYIPSKHARKVAIMAGLPIAVVRPDFVDTGRGA
jgi:hypothetical protein